VKIVDARPEDAGKLSSIAQAAKSHWGYPEAWLRRWRDALTVTPDDLRSNPTHVAVEDGRVIGFVAVVLRGGEAFVEHLWVAPGEMGRGAGRLLFEHAERLARAAGAGALRVESDPHAESFYVHMGATCYGRVPAAMDGTERFLPLLVKPL
jgi:GNAT superfamily N-acetyltransferase